MTIDANELTERGRRLADDGEPRTRSPDRAAVYGGGGGGPTRVVLRSVDLEARTLSFQRLRYATSPPEEGQYETYGEALTGYPIETDVCESYLPWVWPDGEGSEPVSTETVPLLAVRERGYWILWLPCKVLGTLLSPDEPANACSFG